MKILVTGSSGFVARHLINELGTNDHSIVATDIAPETDSPYVSKNIALDLRDGNGIAEIIASEKPDACVHLGAIASITDGQNDPALMLSVNILGTINLLEAFRDHLKTARIIVVSTSRVYGTHDSDELINENTPMSPTSLYGISKAACDMASLAFARKHDMHIMTVRPTNHSGPGQSEKFVIPSFARQLKQMKNKSGVKMMVGNLDSERFFLDVRDVTRAYRLLLEKGRPGEAYNVSSNQRVSVRLVLNELISISGANPEVVMDHKRYRPTEKQPAMDTLKLYKDTGWTPKIPIRQTLKDLFEAI